MKGREENKEVAENKALSIIKDRPEILTLYYNRAFENSTHNTKLIYIRHVNDFLMFLEDNDIINTNIIEEFSKVDTEIIESYIDTTKHSQISRKKKQNKESGRAVKVYAILHFFKFLSKRKIISVNPCLDIVPPKPKEEIEVVSLNAAEIKLLQSNIVNGTGSHRARIKQEKWKNRDLSIVQLGLTTGLRVTSMSEINIEDIDFDRNVIKVIDKGNITKESHITDKTAVTLKEWIKDREQLLGDEESDALFISNQRKRISTKAISCILEKYTVNINKHVTPHKLRSSCATNLYEETEDIYMVATVLGHKNLKNTERYTKVSTQQRKEAARKLDGLL